MQVQALLMARADAVRTHDRAGFLSTMEPAGPGAVGQLRRFDGLTALPFDRYAYEALAAGSPPVPSPAGLRWTATATVASALDGADPAPVRERRRMTFVARGGRWRVADDQPDGSAADRGPWDEGVVTVARSRSCLVVGHPAQAVVVRQVAAGCDRAAATVTSVWGSGWARRAIVLVAADAAELGRLRPGAGDLSGAAAVETGASPVAGQGGRPSGDRVLVDAAVFARLTALGRRVVLAHELTHVASRAATGPQVPAWLVEGLADLVGYRDAGLPVAVAARELRADVRAGRLPVSLPGDASFHGSGVQQAYEGSWLAVRVLMDAHGLPSVLRLYRQVGADPRPGGLDRGLATVGTTRARLTHAWRLALLRSLR